jgi:membrane-associated phospholipid phosphatase
VKFYIKRFLCLLCFAAAALHSYAESVYTYDFKKDIAIGSLALGISIAPFFIENAPKAAPALLDKSGVNDFDRSLMFSYNKPLDIISDTGVYGLLVLPALSLAGNLKDTDALLTYGIMYAEAFLLTNGTKELLKSGIIRYRPYMYAGAIPNGKEDDYYNSFPSGSTALAFLSAGFVSSTFATEYSDSPWKIPVISGAYVLAGGIAASRILSGSHFLSDVLAGAAIGSLYGYLVPWLHLKSPRGVSVSPLANGFVVSWAVR